MLETVDAIVLGRVTYAMFASYWPSVTPDEEGVAGPINTLPKHVVSNTLDAAAWGDGEAAIERGDGVASVRRLAAQYAGDLIVWGSLTLTDALLEADAVDVLRLRLVPALLGAGRPFTPASLGLRGLRLTGSTAHGGGHVTLQYEVERPAAT